MISHPHARALALVLALLGSGPAAAAQLDALIWGAEPTAEAARARVPEVTRQLQAAGFTFPAGFPLAIRSDQVSGLKPGFEIIILGYCPPEQSRSVLQAAKAINPGTYFRKVEVTPAGPSCPAPGSNAPAPVQASPTKPEAPAVYALVFGAERSEAEADRLILEAQRRNEATFAEGFPRRMHQKDIRLVPHADPNVRARKQGLHLAIGGFCDEAATRVLGDLFSSAFFERVGSNPPPLACPRPTLESTNSRLLSAAGGSDVELLRAWIAQGPDQHGKDEALLKAAEYCNAEAVKLLLEAGASPKAEASGTSSARESTALMAAVGGWSPKDECLVPMLQLLLDAGADPNRTDSHGTTPVELAARASVAATKLLLSRGADPRKARRSPLTRAVLAAHPELVPVLLERGVAVDLPGDCGDNKDCTPLLAATLADDVESARQLRARGASLEGRSPTGLTALDILLLLDLPGDRGAKMVAALLDHPSTALHRAAYAGDVTTMQPLLTRDKVNARQGGWTPLMLAAIAGKADAVKALLAAGADPNAQTGEPGSPHGQQSVLMLGVMSGSASVVDQLLQAKADAAALSSVCCGTDRWTSPWSFGVRVFIPWAAFRSAGRDPEFDPKRSYISRVQVGLKDVDGWRATGSYDDKRDKTYLVRLTPLHAAAMLGHAQVVERLIAAGAPVDRRDEQGPGLTPLMLAVEEGHLDVVQALFKAGAALDAVDTEGNPVLARALARGAPQPVIDALMKKGGAPLLKNPKVLAAAALHAPIEVVKVLLAKGAGKGGAGKAAARELCDRAEDSDRDAQVFALLEEAGYDIHKSYYGDCISEGD